MMPNKAIKKRKNMENSTENAENTSDTNEKTRKPRGPRSVYFVCAAVVESDEDPLVQDYILVDRDLSDEEMKDQAIVRFTEKHDVEPVSVLGPVFQAKLQQVQQPKKRTRVRISTDEIRFTGKAIHAEYDGWKVVGHYIKDEEGNEKDNVVALIFGDDISAGEKKRAKPQMKVVDITSLKNVQA
jgi:hypothetical protein